MIDLDDINKIHGTMLIVLAALEKMRDELKGEERLDIASAHYRALCLIESIQDIRKRVESDYYRYWEKKTLLALLPQEPEKP